MPKKPETGLSRKVLSRLRAEGGLWVKNHGGPYTEAGVADITGCWVSRYVAIELKMPGEEPSELQKRFLNGVHRNGGLAGVAYSVQEALDIRNGKKIFIPFKETGVDISTEP
jgi:hypothetical protein